MKFVKVRTRFANNKMRFALVEQLRHYTDVTGDDDFDLIALPQAISVALNWRSVVGRRKTVFVRVKR